MVPAAAVIPAPIAYIKVVAVKKLVVDFLVEVADLPLCGLRGSLCLFSRVWVALICCSYNTHCLL
jgi:hypothetical protein